METVNFDDLIGIPYKIHGRDTNGFDCYGLVLECCHRVGKPLKDVYYESIKIKSSQKNDYIQNGLNIEPIPKSEKYCLVELRGDDFLHIGFMLDKKNVLHATIKHGSKVSPIENLEVIGFYKVV